MPKPSRKWRSCSINVNLYSALSLLQKSAYIMWAVCHKVVAFRLQPTHEPYLPLFHSRKALPPFGWYLLRLATNWHKGWPGWVDLGGWLHTEINVQHRRVNAKTVTHPSTNWARRRLSSLIERNTLPLRQTTTNPSLHNDDMDKVVSLFPVRPRGTHWRWPCVVYCWHWLSFTLFTVDDLTVPWVRLRRRAYEIV